MGKLNAAHPRWLRMAILTGAAMLAVAPGRFVAGPGPSVGTWQPSNAIVFNKVVSSPTSGGGYDEPAPVEGGCVGPTPGDRLNFNANHSESWLTVRPGTDQLVGTSKFFFDKFSTFYNFYLGSYNINGATINGPNGSASNNIVQGYDCTTTGTQEMPPTWTNTTDPNADFDTQGRVYQTMLPFNAFWTTLNPNGEITVSYSDDMGAHWKIGNQGKALEFVPNESSFSFNFEDKQFIAVNHFPQSAANPNTDHVYAVWDLGNSAGNTVYIREATSRDHGQTFSPAQTISLAHIDQNRNAYPLPAVDPAGNVYVVYNNIGRINQTSDDFYVIRSTDDGATFGAPTLIATTNLNSNGAGSAGPPNTTFRNGIANGFAASPSYPGHLYLAYNKWDGTQYDVFFTQSVDYGQHWSSPLKVNDNVDAAGVPTDQFQPAVAAGPNGAVAVGFYDRRAACPDDKSVIPQDVRRTNFCIDVSVQPYKDGGTGAAAVGPNIRASQYTWDPQQPGLLVHNDGTTSDLQTLGGYGQMACASHNDPCKTSFIGDYFSVAISGTNIYTFSVSTHYPSTLKADPTSALPGNLYYQQQVLGTISRASVGL